MKLAREETKIKVTGRRFYRKNNLKFEGRNRSRNRSRNRNRGQKIWDPEPEPEPRQNGTVPQHWYHWRTLKENKWSHAVLCIQNIIRIRFYSVGTGRWKRFIVIVSMTALIPVTFMMSLHDFLNKCDVYGFYGGINVHYGLQDRNIHDIMMMSWSSRLLS